jgi:hypothetical protein
LKIPSKKNVSNLFAIFCCTYAVKSNPKPDFFTRDMSYNTQYLWKNKLKMESVEYLQIKGVTKNKFVRTRIVSTLLLLVALFCVDVKNEFSW